MMTAKELKPVEYVPVNIYDIKSVNRDAYPLVARVVDYELLRVKDIEELRASDKEQISILENKVMSQREVIESQSGYMTRLKNEKRDENGEKRKKMIDGCMYAFDSMLKENELMLATPIDPKAYQKLKDRITEYIMQEA